MLIFYREFFVINHLGERNGGNYGENKLPIGKGGGESLEYYRALREIG